jgi:hypothetical protein
VSRWLLGLGAGALLGFEFWNTKTKLDLANATLGGITTPISLGAGLYLIAFGVAGVLIGGLLESARGQQTAPGTQSRFWAEASAAWRSSPNMRHR